MVIEEAIFDHLTGDAGVAALVGTRIYPTVIPQDAALPACAYQRISGPRDLAHDGPTGQALARIQFTCTATSYGAVKGLANAIREALDGFSGTMGSPSGAVVHVAMVDNEIDGYNQQTGLQTVRLDVIFRYIE